MGSIGWPELLIVLGIVLLIFGPKRLPGIGRQVGAGMRNFRDAITGREEKEEREQEARRIAAANVAKASAEPPAAAGAPAGESREQPAERS